jgi:uncharacterized protein YraI
MVTSAANGSARGKRRDDGLCDREETTVVANGIERGIGQVLVDVDEAMGNRLNRRRMLRVMATAGAAVVAGGVVKAMPAGAEEYTFLKATVNLNLREQPSTSAKVIVVIPKGAKVALVSGKAKNGFRHVSLKGATGWAYGDYLILADSPEGAAFFGTAKTTANVNLRHGPSTNDEVLEVVAKGTTVSVSDWVSGGFRYVEVDGYLGWISEQYLKYDV